MAAATLPGLAAAADPPQRTKGSHLKLSLAGYSFNRQMARRGTTEQIQKAEMSLEKLILFCAEHGVGAAELTGYYFPAEITPPTSHHSSLSHIATESPSRELPSATTSACRKATPASSNWQNVGSGSTMPPFSVRLAIRIFAWQGPRR
ncbi:MAG UNVERIFIED_CONTAM: hypothetical protein LVR18_49520 [Planctomycetaceae bacterium]|jgi:hypothetical protein